MSQAKIVLRRSQDRGHADHGWLNTYHTFSFASYHSPLHTSFGSLRVLNEDRVAPGTGFPTHPHRDAEIFSYVLSGELTHRDSMIKPGSEAVSLKSATGDKRNDFYRLHRSDIQFTTGGTGIAHSEQNESPDTWVHFLQIWATPWARGLKPRYHTETFPEAGKREGFVAILSPLKAGIGASMEEEEEAAPSVKGTIPVHADLCVGAGILGKVGRGFGWVVGGLDGEGRRATRKERGRRVYVHVVMTQGGRARVRLDGQEDKVLGEGDGAYVTGVDAGFELRVESVGEADAEVVVLDSD